MPTQLVYLGTVGLLANKLERGTEVYLCPTILPKHDLWGKKLGRSVLFQHRLFPRAPAEPDDCQGGEGQTRDLAQ